MRHDDVTTAPRVYNARKRLALESNHEPISEPLVTPDHVDRATKQRTADFRRAITSQNKRKKTVAADPAANGVDALSAELQQTHASVATTANTSVPVEEPAGPPVPKRRQTIQVTQPTMPATLPVSTGQPIIKCQGCIHCDLLELHMMEPTIIRHYLKDNAFLNLAKCAGDCKRTIKNVHQASPKANLFYCDETIKGFHAPDDDPTKAGMECGLILCVPCHALRETRYTQEHEKEGPDVNRRTSRRKKSN